MKLIKHSRCGNGYHKYENILELVIEYLLLNENDSSNIWEP